MRNYKAVLISLTIAIISSGCSTTPDSKAVRGWKPTHGQTSELAFADRNACKQWGVTKDPRGDRWERHYRLCMLERGYVMVEYSDGFAPGHPDSVKSDE